MSISHLPHSSDHARAASPVRVSSSTVRPRQHLSEPSVALVRDNVYAILDDRDTMGFVERVGSVYVALSGERQIKAVEAGQSLSWDVAVDMVVLAHRRRRSNPS